jgi:hypothetical protein
MWRLAENAVNKQSLTSDKADNRPAVGTSYETLRREAEVYLFFYFLVLFPAKVLGQE